MKKRDEKEGANGSHLSQIGLSIKNGNPQELEILESKLRADYDSMPIPDDEELAEDEIEANMLALSAFVEMGEDWTAEVFNEEKQKHQRRKKKRFLLRTTFITSAAALILVFFIFEQVNKGNDGTQKKLVLAKKETHTVKRKPLSPTTIAKKKNIRRSTSNKQNTSVSSTRQKVVTQANKIKAAPKQNPVALLAYAENPVMEKMRKAKAFVPEGIILPEQIDSKKNFHFESREGAEYEVAIYDNRPNSAPVMEFVLRRKPKERC